MAKKVGRTKKKYYFLAWLTSKIALKKTFLNLRFFLPIENCLAKGTILKTMQKSHIYILVNNKYLPTDFYPIKNYIQKDFLREKKSIHLFTAKNSERTKYYKKKIIS